MPLSNSPRTLKECFALLMSSDLDLMLRVRLVQLVFGDNPSASIKAVEMLLTIPRPKTDVELELLSSESLENAEGRALDYLVKSGLYESGEDDG